MYNKSEPGSIGVHPDSNHIPSLEEDRHMANSKFTIDSEIWKPIPDYPGYEASSFGRVRSFWKRLGPGSKVLSDQSQRILSQWLDDCGYYRVQIKGKNRTVHRLVLEAFQGPCPPGFESRHLDGIRKNVHESNLRWGTKKENTDDRTRHGNCQNLIRGEKQWKAKLTARDAKEIREIYAQGLYSQPQLGKIFGVSHSQIGYVIRRKSWAHI